MVIVACVTLCAGMVIGAAGGVSTMPVSVAVVVAAKVMLRLASLVGEPLRSRLGELTAGQLVALRFASDGEIPGLVDKVLRDKMTRADIKKAIVTWRPDYQRV